MPQSRPRDTGKFPVTFPCISVVGYIWLGFPATWWNNGISAVSTTQTFKRTPDRHTLAELREFLKDIPNDFRADEAYIAPAERPVLC